MMERDWQKSETSADRTDDEDDRPEAEAGGVDAAAADRYDNVEANDEYDKARADARGDYAEVDGEYDHAEKGARGDYAEANDRYDNVKTGAGYGHAAAGDGYDDAAADAVDDDVEAGAEDDYAEAEAGGEYAGAGAEDDYAGLDAGLEEEEDDLPPLDERALNEMIEEICNSKAEEFHMLGYESVTGRDVWDCISSKYKTTPPLHRIVNDILSLRATNLMNWITLTAWKQSEK